MLRFGLLVLVAAAAATYLLLLNPDGSLAGRDSPQECYEPRIGGAAIFEPGVRVAESPQGLLIDCTVFEPENPLQAGDLIVSIDGVSVATTDEYLKAVTLGVARRKPITFEVERAGERMTISCSSGGVGCTGNP